MIIDTSNISEKLIVCVDLDGTLLEYEKWMGIEKFGKPLPGAREAMQAFHDAGFLIVIHTCRGNIRQVAEVLAKNEIIFDHINTHPLQPPVANQHHPTR